MVRAAQPPCFRSEVEVPAKPDVGFVVHTEFAESGPARAELESRAIAVRATAGRENQAQLRAGSEPHVILLVRGHVESGVPGYVTPPQSLTADVLDSDLQAQG